MTIINPIQLLIMIRKNNLFLKKIILLVLNNKLQNYLSKLKIKKKKQFPKI